LLQSEPFEPHAGFLHDSQDQAGAPSLGIRGGIPVCFQQSSGTWLGAHPFLAFYFSVEEIGDYMAQDNPFRAGGVWPKFKSTPSTSHQPMANGVDREFCVVAEVEFF
jgi:hypothetical protein